MYNFRIIYTLDYYNDREVGYDFTGTIEELENEVSKIRKSDVSNIFVHCGNGNKELAFEVDARIGKYNATAGY